MARQRRVVDDADRPFSGLTESLPVVTVAIGRRWSRSVFGVVAAGATRRRPSDVVRLAVAVLVTAVFAAGATVTTTIEQAWFDLFAALPSGLEGVFSVLYGLGAVVAGALVVSAVVTRRVALLVTLLVAGLVGWAAAGLMSDLIDVPAMIREAGVAARGRVPDFPVVPLSVSVAVILAAVPHLTRPARRLVVVVVWLATVASVYLAAGFPAAVLTSVVVGWGAAALAHLVFGSPGGLPDAEQVTRSLEALGVSADGLQLDPDQGWGHTSFTSSTDDRLAVEVVGRDSTEARLLAKIWRFIWYKDSGPTLSLRRGQQVEQQALVLLLAARSRAAVPELVAFGLAGDRDDALLVVRRPAGRLLADLDEVELDDRVLDEVWGTLGRLNEAGIAHGEITARRVTVDDQGACGLVRLERASVSAPVQAITLDRAQLLVATADLVGVDRSLAAAHRSLGDDGVAGLLPFLEPAAIGGRSRSEIADLKSLTGDLAAAGSDLLGVERPDPFQLRRFSLGGIFLAAAFALGVYLLVAQLAGLAEVADVLTGAQWPWVAASAVVAITTPVVQAVAMLGSVAAPLPLRLVTVVQFANAFTGLIGGTAGNATLVIRFFQKQGLAPSVAVSSGVLNSLAGFLVQIVLVFTGLLLAGAAFEFTTDGFTVPGWVSALVTVALVGLAVSLVFPTVRRRISGLVAEQVSAAFANVRDVLSTPRKAVQLFGGNLASQVLFAMALGAALHAYGQSLPLLQIIVINSFASFVGGAVPVPGGMGVVEAGMIAGFTAAGVPEAEAVAATFTARAFTAYLPPIWGWFCFRWLTRHDCV